MFIVMHEMDIYCFSGSKRQSDQQHQVFTSNTNEEMYVDRRTCD